MKTAGITGATSGIGKAMALYLAKRGYNLVLIGRNNKKLNEMCKKLNSTDSSNNKCSYITCDLTDTASVLALADTLKCIELDIFINCAGFGELGDLTDTYVSNDMDMIEVNIKALHILTKQVSHDMMKRNHGYIMNVASSAGLMPAGPHMSTYYATKAYVVSLTASLYQELKERHSKVHVSILCPGPVNTGFNDTAGVTFALKGISAEYCASYALRQMFAGKCLIIPTAKMKFACLGVRLIPWKLATKIVSRQQMKKAKVL